MNNPLSNFSFSLVARVLENIIMLLFNAFAARILGKESFGLFFYGISIVIFLTAIADMGMSNLIIREFAINPEKGKDFFSRIFFPRFIILISVIFFVYTAGYFLKQPWKIRSVYFELTIAYSLYTLSDWFLDIFRGREEMHWPALAVLLYKSSVFIFGIVFLSCGYGILGLLHTYMISGVLLLISTIVLVRKKHGHFRLEYKFQIPIRVLVEGVPFMLARILGMLSTRVGIYLLPFFISMEQVGLFGASLRLVDAILFIPVLISAVTFPNFSRLHQSSNSELAHGVNATFKILIIIILPAYFGLQIFSKQIIVLVYGDAFIKTSSILLIHVCMCVFFFMNSLFSTILQSVNKQKNLAVLAAISLVIHFLLLVTLVPAFGITGAAFSALIQEFSMFLICMICYSNYLGIKSLMPGVIKILAATGGMTMVLTVIRGLPILAVAVVAPVIYLVLLVALKPFNDKEISWCLSGLAAVGARNNTTAGY